MQKLLVFSILQTISDMVNSKKFEQYKKNYLFKMNRLTSGINKFTVFEAILQNS